MKTVTTPPYGLACLHPSLASPHTFSPAPTLSRLRVYWRRIRVYQQDQPSLSTDPSPPASDQSLSAGSTESISAGNPLPPLGLGLMKTVTTPPYGLACLHPSLASPHTFSPAPTLSRLRVYWRRIRVYQQDQPSLSTDPSPPASDPSLLDHWHPSLSGQDQLLW